MQAMQQDFHQAPDGARIATYTWLPESGHPRALVQIAHGAAEHGRRYDRFARFLAGHGYAVVASDHRGHGATAASTGGRGVVGEDALAGHRRDLKGHRRPCGAPPTPASRWSCSATAWARCWPATTPRSTAPTSPG